MKITLYFRFMLQKMPLQFITIPNIYIYIFLKGNNQKDIRTSFSKITLITFTLYFCVKYKYIIIFNSIITLYESK